MILLILFLCILLYIRFNPYIEILPNGKIVIWYYRDRYSKIRDKIIL